MCRHSAQDVCPWNVSFAQELEEPAFAPRAVIAGKDARTLAEDLLAMEQVEFNAAFRKSPMKRAKLAGLKRNARVVLGHAGRDDGDGPRGSADQIFDAQAPVDHSSDHRSGTRNVNSTGTFVPIAGIIRHTPRACVRCPQVAA